MDRNRMLDRMLKRSIKDSRTEEAASTDFLPDPSIPQLEYDETFGNQGRMTLSPSGHSLSIAVGMIPKLNDENKFWVIAYEGYPLTQTPNYAAVARITATGQMDLSFGPDNNGFSQIKFGEVGNSFPEFIHESKDGKLIVAGQLDGVEDGGPDPRSMITRLLSSGLPDTSFGAEGTGVVDIDILLNVAIVGSVFYAFYAVDPNGRILVLAASTGPQFGDQMFLARLTPEGALDNSFQDEGVVKIHKNDQPAAPLGIVLDDDTSSKIIITLESVDLSTRLMTCHDIDGNLMTEFGQDGFVNFSEDFDFIANCTLTHESGRLVISGQKKFDDEYYAALANYTTEGAPAPEFNNGKPVYTHFAEEYPDCNWWRGQQFAAAPNAITVLGSYRDQSTYQVIGRYARDGTQDFSYFGQFPQDEFAVYVTHDFISDISGRLLIFGRRADKATIFSIKG